MVELVDTPDLGSGAAMRVGSSPIRRTRETSLVESPFFVRRFMQTADLLVKVDLPVLPV